MPQSQKTLEFLQKLKDKGHWNDDYDYSEVDCIGSKDKIIVIDKSWKSKHLISPVSLLTRNTKCDLRNSINPENLLLKQFRKIHGNKYDYSKVIYNGNTAIVKIFCKQHGEFEKKVNYHLRGMGCVECSGSKKLTNNDVILY